MKILFVFNSKNSFPAWKTGKVYYATYFGIRGGTPYWNLDVEPEGCLGKFVIGILKNNKHFRVLTRQEHMYHRFASRLEDILK